MRSTLKFLVALLVAFVVMLLFRALFFTVYSVNGSGLEPKFTAGDRVVVNRWSYGLRTGGGGLFSYGRLCWQPVCKGEYVAVEDTLGHVLIGRCAALPGDTVTLGGRSKVVLPSKTNCADRDCYYFDRLGIISEEFIIGRVVMVLYNHEAGNPFWRGYQTSRFLSVP